MAFRIIVLLFACCACCTWLPGQKDIRELFVARALTEIREIEARSGGVIGVEAFDLDSGVRLSYHQTAVFTQASVIKIPVLWRLYADVDAGNVDLARIVTLQTNEAVGGSGALQTRLRALGDGTLSISISELALLMIRDSDNTATNKLISIVGMDRVNALLAEKGFRTTRLQRVMIDGAAARADRENISTPQEMAGILAGLATGKWLSSESTAEVLRILGTVNGSVRRALPVDTQVVSKTGAVPGVYGETALVTVGQRRYVMSVASSFVDPLAENPVAAVATAIHRVFERLALSNRYGHRTGGP